MILSNLEGKDKPMALAGEITAVIGTSGTVYRINSKKLKIPQKQP
ncbi:hypothetical protein ACHOLT_10035 [Desulfitobacterium sp. Sab5]